MGIVLADAHTCYDRIAQVFASLVFQAVGVCNTAITVMLTSIQKMKFYLWTGLGESTGYMAAKAGTIKHGLCQGNAATPAGWSLISAVLICRYKALGHGARFETPITRRKYSTVGVLYVDDVDLFSMNLPIATKALWQEVAQSTITSTELLTMPGGSGMGAKCFGYLIDYEWNQCSQWYYTPVLEMELKIVLPDGRREGIALLPSDAARVALGVSTSPDWNDENHLQAKGKQKDKWKSISAWAGFWLDRLKNGHLQPKLAWVSYQLQLLSSV